MGERERERDREIKGKSFASASHPRRRKHGWELMGERWGELRGRLEFRKEKH